MVSMPDPQAILKEVSEKLNEAAKNAGLDKAEAIVKKLEDIKTKAQQGPGDLLEKVKEAFNGFLHTIDEALKDPASLMGGGGILMACASYYGKMVVEKLKAIKVQAEAIFEKLKEAATNLPKPFKELGEGLHEVVASLTEAVSGMMKMPSQVEAIGKEVQSPADFAKVDTAPLKKITDTSGLTGAFDKLNTLKGGLGPVMDKITQILTEFADFLSEAPMKVSKAFDVGCAGCTSAGPAPLQAMQKQLAAVSALDFQPLVDTMKSTRDTVSQLDVESVKKPLESFAGQASTQVEALDKSVAAAKLASGGGALGGIASAVGGMFGKH